MMAKNNNFINPELEKLIRTRIRAENNWLSFEDFMHLALHQPELGYYAAGIDRIGSGGDFITAAELGNLFGQCLAEFIAASMPEDGAILELGPGNGKLAVSILRTLKQKNPSRLPRFFLLETSTSLRHTQQEYIEASGLHLNCEWLNKLPKNFRGIIIANEVLDTLPCRILVKRNSSWFQRGVTLDTNDSFVWQDGPEAEQQDCDRLAEFEFLSEGYHLEINHRAEALVATLAELLSAGAILLADYGFARHELYHPMRNEGTIKAHYQHTISADVLAAPSMRDLSSYVDFTAMAKAATEVGAEVAGFSSQAEFLLDLGIETKAQPLLDQGNIEQQLVSRQLQTLLMPHEMGEQIKMLGLSKGSSMQLPGFRLRSRRL